MPGPAARVSVGSAEVLTDLTTSGRTSEDAAASWPCPLPAEAFETDEISRAPPPQHRPGGGPAARSAPSPTGAATFPAGGAAGFSISTTSSEAARPGVFFAVDFGGDFGGDLGGDLGVPGSEAPATSLLPPQPMPPHDEAARGAFPWREEHTHGFFLRCSW